MKLFDKSTPKIGIAFGGGGARGYAHLGAIKAFEEFGIKFDRVAGTSVGSIVGAFYAAGFSYNQLYEIAKKLRMKDIKTSKIPFTPSKTDGIGEIITSVLGEKNIEDLKIPFSAVAVDLVSTSAVCFSKGPLAKACMGSCAIPGAFQPVEYNGMILADGGLQDTIPSDVLRRYGCDYVIAIDVNKSRTYGTNSTKLMDVAMCSIRILMKSNAEHGYIYADLVIAPETKRFDAMKTENMDEMIEEGYKATIDLMPKIMNIVNSKKRRRYNCDIDMKFID